MHIIIGTESAWMSTRMNQAHVSPGQSLDLTRQDRQYHRSRSDLAFMGIYDTGSGNGTIEIKQLVKYGSDGANSILSFWIPGSSAFSSMRSTQ